MEKIRPSKIWYGVSAVLFVLGGVLFVFQLIGTIKDAGNSGERFLAPSSIEMAIEEAGAYTVYLEQKSTFEGAAYFSADISGLRMMVTDDSLNPITLKSPTMSTTYNVMGRSGEAVFEFYVDQPMTIYIDTYYGEEGGDEVVINVDNNFMGGTFLDIGYMILTLFGFGITALMIFTITIIRRIMDKKRKGGMMDGQNN